MNNSLVFHRIAQVFNLPDLTQTILAYTERCFTMVAETDNFLELDFVLLKKILSSSKLHLTSEVEVFNAADKWLRHDVEGRGKLAKEVLMTVRLSLLSDAALDSLLRANSPICSDSECKLILGSVLRNKDYLSLPSKSFEPRYCDQNLYDVFVCQKLQGVTCLKQMNGKNFQRAESNKTVAVNVNYKNVSAAVCLKGDIYIFSVEVNGCGDKVIAIRKHSAASNLWSGDAVEINYREEYCVCALVDSVYVIGGKIAPSRFSRPHCVRYDAREDAVLCDVATDAARSSAACAVFEGAVVVSGGLVQYDFPSTGPFVASTNTVRAYERESNTWFEMPKTVSDKCRHALVAAPERGKLFAVGTFNPCEVFDRAAGSFAVVKRLARIDHFSNERVKAVRVGSRIAVFGGKCSTIVFYDLDADEWSEEAREFLPGVQYHAGFKVPQM